MSKKSISIVCVCILLLSILAIGTIVFNWPEKLNVHVFGSQGNQIGSQVGPGEGPIPFKLGEGVTHLEATAEVEKLPAIGESLTAKTIADETISGKVLWIGCVQDKRAVATIEAMKYGLVTVGLILR